jgi:hypothetical protein
MQYTTKTQTYELKDRAKRSGDKCGDNSHLNRKTSAKFWAKAYELVGEKCE